MSPDSDALANLGSAELMDQRSACDKITVAHSERVVRLVLTDSASESHAKRRLNVCWNAMRFECLGHSAPHLSFLLVRLGGFAADYFRGHPSALRAAGLSGARCGGFGEADARLITIGELDASRLECTL